MTDSRITIRACKNAVLTAAVLTAVVGWTSYADAQQAGAPELIDLTMRTDANSDPARSGMDAVANSASRPSTESYNAPPREKPGLAVTLDAATSAGSDDGRIDVSEVLPGLDAALGDGRSGVGTDVGVDLGIGDVGIGVSAGADAGGAGLDAGVDAASGASGLGLNADAAASGGSTGLSVNSSTSAGLAGDGGYLAMHGLAIGASTGSWGAATGIGASIGDAGIGVSVDGATSDGAVGVSADAGIGDGSVGASADAGIGDSGIGVGVGVGVGDIGVGVGVGVGDGGSGGSAER